MLSFGVRYIEFRESALCYMVNLSASLVGSFSATMKLSVLPLLTEIVLK